MKISKLTGQMANLNQPIQKSLFQKPKEDLQISLKWNQEWLYDLEDILQTDIPIHEQSDFKNAKEVRDEIKRTKKVIKQLQEEIDSVN